MRNNRTVTLRSSRAWDPATVYVTIGFIGGVSTSIGKGGDGAMLSEHELRELAATGWELARTRLPTQTL